MKRATRSVIGKVTEGVNSKRAALNDTAVRRSSFQNVSATRTKVV